MKTVKNVFFVAAVVGLMGLIGLVQKAEAATTGTITVTVTVQKISVSLTNNNPDLGTVAEASVTNFATPVVVTNDGNIQEDMKLNCGSDPAGWTKVANDTPGSDQYDIRALFLADLTGVVDADFAVGSDTLTTSPVTAAADAFARAADAVGVKGYDVPSSVTPTRNLYLQFRAPSANTQAGAKNITVTVTAIAG